MIYQPRLVATLLLATGVVLTAVAAASGQPVADATPADASPANASPIGVLPGTAGGPVGGPPANVAANANICGLLVPGSTAMTSSGCLACHGRLVTHAHPVDFDYARWGRASGAIALRPVNEVQRSGLSLPDGQVRCVTCHDASSPWKSHIKLPQGSAATPAVDLKRPVTYENRRALPPPRPGDDVGKKALCVVCHAVD